MTILEVLREVQAQRIDDVIFEVIVIDDGSKDATVTLLEENPGLYSKLIKMEKNGGKGAAVKAGLSVASGDYVLFQDADLEYSPDEYKALLMPVLRFDADLVMSSRFAAPAYTRVAYFWNKIGNHLITLFFNILNNTTFTDIYSCYMLFRRDLVPAINSNEWDGASMPRSCPSPNGRPEISMKYPSATMAAPSKRERRSALTM